MSLTDKELLAVIAFADALDPYGIAGDTDPAQLAGAWRTSLPFWVDVDMAREAVRGHYLESSKRIAIADIVRRCRQIKDQRAVEGERQLESADNGARKYVPMPDWFKERWGHLFPSDYGNPKNQPVRK